MKPKPFKTEADLCAAFIAAIGDGWTAYAETAGWDIVLVRKTDGFQIGVQAKLKLNALVLAQAVDENRYQVDKPGPDCVAILVPWGEVSVGLGFLCAYVGVTIVRATAKKQWGQKPFQPSLPEIGKEWSERDWHELAPARRCKLPSYVPDVPAGARSPLQLTEWKISALKLEALLERQGFVTRQDFRAVGIDHRRWLAPGNGWLARQGERFVPGPHFPNFKVGHPVAYQRIKDDEEKWRKTRETAQLPLSPGA